MIKLASVIGCVGFSIFPHIFSQNKTKQRATAKSETQTLIWTDSSMIRLKDSGVNCLNLPESTHLGYLTTEV